MQLTKLRAAPVLRAEVPPCAPAGRMDGGTASQLIRSVRRTGDMMRALDLVALVGLGGVTVLGGGCGPHECPTCPAPLPAIVVRVTAAGSVGPVAGAFIVVQPVSPTGTSVAVTCTPEADASVCMANTGGGTFRIAVGAPGFTTAERDATVVYTSGECCYSVAGAHFDVALTPSI
jgi:hypothetical protein